MIDSPLPFESRRTVIVRRLTGLVVLLLATFFASLLIHSHEGQPADEGLPTVVVPLQTTQSSGVATAVLEAAPAEVPSEPITKGAAATVSSLKAAEPVAREVPAEKAPAQSVASTPKPQPKVSIEKRSVKAASQPSVVATKPSPKPVAARRQWHVVVGAFRDPAVAKAVAQRIHTAGFKSSIVATAPVKGERLQRVSAGPFESEDAAQSARATLIVEGLTKAIVQSPN